MLNKDIQCNNCSHKDVCKYREDYEKSYTEITSKVGSEVIKNVIKVNLNCNYFQSKPWDGRGQNVDDNWRYSYTNRYS